jgi:redox-sensitive bicupin YhaK (pirin superfamily)
MGFGKHPHDNMEIVTIPLEGDLHHNDSTGRDEIIRANDVQIMSAGSGIYHSEYNANNDKPVKLFQIWVFPKEKNIKPRYEQLTFSAADRINKFQTVVAPDNNNAVWINQDAWFSLGDFDANQTQAYNLHKSGSGVYVIVVNGQVKIGEQELGARDAIAISETESFEFTATAKSSLLLIEVPMQW